MACPLCVLVWIGLKERSTLSQTAGLHFVISAKPTFDHHGCNSVFLGADSGSAIAALLSNEMMHPKAAPLFEHAHGCAALSSFSCCFAPSFTYLCQLLLPIFVPKNHHKIGSTSQRSHSLFYCQEFPSHHNHDIFQMSNLFLSLSPRSLSILGLVPTTPAVRNRC